jgi:maleate isomerase
MINPLSQNHRRIGLLIPSSNTTMEIDFYQNMPPGISVHTARMFMEDTTVAGESRMLDEFALPAVRDIATAHPDVVVFGCTSAGALRGNDYDDQLCQRISGITGVPTVSVIKSAREALQECGASRLIVVTPYVDELNERIKKSLEDDGLEILKITGLGISENFQIAMVPDQDIYDFSLQAVRGLSPDALFISCTNFPAMRVLELIRRAVSFPVITSNQAVLERALAIIGASTSTP